MRAILCRLFSFIFGGYEKSINDILRQHPGWSREDAAEELFKEDAW